MVLNVRTYTCIRVCFCVCECTQMDSMDCSCVCYCMWMCANCLFTSTLFFFVSLSFCSLFFHSVNFMYVLVASPFVACNLFGISMFLLLLVLLANVTNILNVIDLYFNKTKSRHMPKHTSVHLCVHIKGLSL